MTDMKTIREKDDKALASFITEQRTVVQNARFGMGGGDVKAAKAAKKDIARAMTELSTRANTANTN